MVAPLPPGTIPNIGARFVRDPGKSGRGVEHIPNCPLLVPGILSGRSPQPQELGLLDPQGNIQGQ